MTQGLWARSPGPLGPLGTCAGSFSLRAYCPIQPGSSFHLVCHLTCQDLSDNLMPIKAFYRIPSPKAQAQLVLPPLLAMDGRHLLCWDDASKLERLTAILPPGPFPLCEDAEATDVDAGEYFCPPAPGPPGKWTSCYTYGDSQRKSVLISKHLDFINSTLQENLGPR